MNVETIGGFGGLAAPTLGLAPVALALARLGIISDFSGVRLERTERTTLQGRPVVRFSVVAALRGVDS